MTRVLVVDDSAFMRKALSIMLERDPEIEVIATARDGEEGFELVKQLKPDVVTLDIEMPRTNGLECIQMIMDQAPTPILVVSSLTTQGAQTTLKAMEIGAADFIPKTQSFVAMDITKIEDDLLSKVKTLSRKRVFSKRAKATAEQLTPSNGRASSAKPKLTLGKIDCVAIGVSTGGPPVVQKLLSELPADFPTPILIAQHMPKEFTATFAHRLDSLTQIRVKEAIHGDVLEPGTAYIGKGGKHLTVQRKGAKVYINLTREPADLLYHPSADVLFKSVAETYGGMTLGLILTGMGKDGVIGLAELKQRGGRILAQDEASCVVYGMPKAAVDAGLASAVMDVQSISTEMLSIGQA